MMKIEDMKRRKKELGYTNEDVSERSGVPLGTVQKVFSGATKNPRIDTLMAMELALQEPLSADYRYDAESSYPFEVRETPAEFIAATDEHNLNHNKVNARRFDSWISEEEPSERWPRQGAYTVEDYYAVPDDIRVELIDGVIYDLGVPSIAHQLIIGELYYQFYRCIEESGRPCMVFFSPFGVRLDKDSKTMVLPDLLITCDPEFDVEGKHYEGPPELIVEVLSHSTRKKDCTIKFRKYMTAGVKEYWIVDPKNERVLIYCFEDDILPAHYSFDDSIPVGISEGRCIIDFARIKSKLKISGDRR